ncbi:MAG: SMC family ATPase [Candidatus Sericytochromatia bacterium]|nr:SMC family ATPase [Candidatus Sericytochromatia bacterium]
MRPFHLQLEGFMAFRDATEIDLSHCDIFVLTGPTGAGKSSLLDAISFALYGETPRIGPKELKKLIYQDIENPRNTARVSLSFRHQQQDYRILRQLSESGQRVELESRKSPDAPWETHTVGKVSEFKQLMPRLLGLDFKAFSRVLMLPQGGFDHFLKQDGAKERRALLLHLAQLDIYEAIQAQADLARRKAEQEQSHLKGQLSGLGEISAEGLQALQNSLQTAEQNLQSLEAAAAHRAEALSRAENLWQDLQALQALEAEQAELAAQTDAISALEHRIAAGQALRELGADFRQWRSLQTRQQQWQQESTSLASAAQELQATQMALKDAQDALATALNTLPEQEARLQQLQHLQPELTRWQRLQQTLQQQTQALSQTEASQQQIQQDIAAQQQQLAQAQTELERLDSTASQLQLDAERLDLLHHVGPDLKLLQVEKMPQAAALSQEATQLQAEIQQQTAQQAQLAEQQQAQEQLYRQARQQAVAAADTLENLQRQSQADALRQHLQQHPDQPCPVCLQPVTEPPAVAAAAAADLSAASAALKAARAAEATAQQQLESSRQALAVQASESRQSAQQLASLQSKREQLNSEIAQRSAALRQALQLSAGDALPDWAEIKAEFSRLRAQRAQVRQIEAQLQQQREQLLLAESALALARQHSQTQQERKQELTAQLQQTRTEHRALQQDLVALLGQTADFATAQQQQLQQLRTQTQQLRQQQAELAERQQTLQQAQIQHQSEADSLQRQGQQIQHELDGLIQALTSACQDLGYADIGAAEADLPTAESLQSWQAEVRAHHSQQVSLLQQLQQLQARIGTQQLSESELASLRQQVQADQTQLQQLNTDIALLQRDLAQARQKQQQSLEWRETLADVEHDLGLYQRIYHDLGSRQLPDFLAKRILERVISSGSQELERLSQGRYRFELDAQEELVILDAWNAHEPRSVKTLSGGESFLASLALALALNSWLAGGIQLDSLFIDEGFGTLDAESLEQATGVIENLQLSGKCVGIITHIPELAERFEHRLQVSKSDLGARVAWQ